MSTLLLLLQLLRTSSNAVRKEFRDPRVLQRLVAIAGVRVRATMRQYFIRRRRRFVPLLFHFLKSSNRVPPPFQIFGDGPHADVKSPLGRHAFVDHFVQHGHDDAGRYWFRGVFQSRHDIAVGRFVPRQLVFRHAHMAFQRDLPSTHVRALAKQPFPFGTQMVRVGAGSFAVVQHVQPFEQCSFFKRGWWVFLQ